MPSNPIVALVGRPNVGKSTLFNRLVGQRLAVTHDIPGTTRDRLQSESYWNGFTFYVIDTGGIEVYQPRGNKDESPLAEGSAGFVPQITAQAILAVEEADVIVMVVDAIQGITAADESVAETLRRTNKPVIIAANKIDDNAHADDAFEFYALGLGAVYPISAIHSAGVGDLLDGITNELQNMETDSREEDDDDHLRIAIVGRPNAGKSTLLNKLIGSERTIVSPIAGTTRDAVDTSLRWHGMPVTIIDTAGIRRRGRIEPGVERFSVIRAMKSIQRSDIALLVIDANEGVTEQDEHIAGYVIEEFKSLIIIINKWDAIEKNAYTMTDFTHQIRDRLHFVPYAPLIFISALTGQRIHQVLEKAYEIWEARFFRIPTSNLNRIIRDAIEHHPPPSKGTKRPKIYYASQVRTDPPVILCHVNNSDLIHFTYKRYLENRIRGEYPFEGTPIRLSFRNRDPKSLN